MTPSVAAVTIRFPLGCQEALRTVVPLCERDTTSRCAALSQMRAVSPLLAVTIKRPSGLQAARVTRSFALPNGAGTCTLPTSQRRKPSALAVIIRLSFGLQAAPVTVLWCRNDCSGLPVLESQMRAVLSLLVVTTRVPSLLQEALVTVLVLELCNLRPSITK